MALISRTPQIKYDVFLSFRGIDTRNTFTSHLCKALRDKQIETFMDDILNRGDEISPSLLSTIEESHISIVIFSKNYASSRWCLEELVKIVECRENHKQIVIPVFYEIDPSDVRNQTGSYAEAFAQQEQRLDRVQRIQTWKEALKKAADLSGFDSRVITPESELVNIIVDDVLKKLDNMSPSYNTNLPGMNSRIKEIESLLMGGDVRILGIWGIGGIGKTTLAKEVFNKISCQFDGSFFSDSARKNSKQGSLRLDSLRLRSALLKDGNACMDTITEKRLGRMKLLIILDDVTDSGQINDLIGDPDRLAPASRIIITSRDKQVLKTCKVHHIYQVKELCRDDALKLFCQHAFRQNHPEVDYKELSNSVVTTVGGVPLALTVLGSALLKKEKKLWESKLKKLENNFEKNIHDVLEISYDELDGREKSLFLDIACFFKGWDIDIVKMIMDDCGSFDDEIRNLIDKSLITESRNMLTMHDLLQAMGKEIVRRQSLNNPGKRTRLWCHKDIYDVLTKDKGSKMIEAISLDMSSSNVRDINLTPRAFTKMKKLRLLNFYVNDFRDNCGNKVHVPEDLIEFDFTELKYFCWHGFPLKSLQPKFHFEKLVELEMCDSNIKELWSGDVQPLHNLKRINLSGSQHLVRFPDLSTAPNLEELNLIACTSLSKILSSIQHLNKLKYLFLGACKSLESIPDCNCWESLRLLHIKKCSKLERLPQLSTNLYKIDLFGCTSLVEIHSSLSRLHQVESLTLKGNKSLTSIPDLRGLKSLTKLSISRCSELKMLPELPNTIKELTLKDVPIEEFPPSSEDLYRLRFLRLCSCSMLKSLPSSIRKWKSLIRVELHNCSKIDKLPDDIGTLKSLKYFWADVTTIGEVPSSISRLKSLKELRMNRCEGVDGVGLLLPPNLLGLENLSTLILSGCGITKLPDSLGDLTSLEILVLDRNNFGSIPGSIINLSKLEYLDISYCRRLRELPQLPALTTIKAVNCTSLERSSYFAFQNYISKKRSYRLSLEANFINCCNLDLEAHMKDTLLKIQRQVALYPKNYYQQDDLSGHYLLPASIIYPKSKIPEWFHYQSRGSFIDVKLPPLCLNCNFLCFALCVVVAIPNPDRQCNHPDDEWHGSSEVTYDCYVKSKDGNRRVESNLFGYDQCHGKPNPSLKMAYFPLDYMKSNHVIIGFGYCFFREFCDNEFSFQFNVTADPNRKYVDVEMCGVHLMKDLHLETSDESEEEDESYSEDETSDESEEEDESDLEEFDEEDESDLEESDGEPHPKRLKHIE